MCLVCRIIKATNTHSEYVILIFLWQQWLRARASMLRYTYIVCLVMFCFALRSWDGVVSIETRLWAGNQNIKVRFLAEARDFYVF